jgi:hypothetical protein
MTRYLALDVEVGCGNPTHGFPPIACGCPSSQLHVLQPWVYCPNKLLAVCENCGAWQLILAEREEAVVIRLPDAEELWEVARSPAGRGVRVGGLTTGGEMPKGRVSQIDK